MLLIVSTFVACKEVPPYIDHAGDTSTQLLDSVYFVAEGNLPTPPKKNAVIEDFSGVRCVNCPAANTKANKIRSKYSGDLFVVTLHPNNPNNFSTPHTDQEDLRTEVAEQIHSQIYPNPGSWPYGGVNRILDESSNSIVLAPATWESKALEEMGKNDEVDLEVKIVKVDSVIHQVTVEYEIISLKGATNPPHLSIFVLEDDITTTQVTDTGKIKKYKHKHVLRQMLTPYNGNQIHETFEQGLGVKRRITYEIDPKVVLRNTSLLLMVHNVLDNQEILQSMEVPLY